MNYNNWSQKIHGLAKEKGWFDGKPRSEAEIMQLVVSEICEATEEVRNSRPAVYVNNNGVCEIGELDFVSFIKLDGTEDPMNPKKTYMKPEGEAVELADALIRMLDYAAFKDINVNGAIQEINSVKKNQDAQTKYFQLLTEMSPLEQHYSLCHTIFSSLPLSLLIANFVLETEALFQVRGWNLEKVVSIKHQYNTTRPYRHGGKAL